MDTGAAPSNEKPGADLTVAPRAPTFREALRFWLKLGFISFGGPAGQIALMQEELVERRRWIGPGRFLHALNFCMVLPGPEAQQLAIYCGWLLHRTWGGVAAGALFVLPSAFILWGLSYAYAAHGEVPWVAAFFAGLKAAVVAVVAAAVVRIGGKALRGVGHWGIAAAAFVLLALGGVGFGWIIAGAALVGWGGARWWPQGFPVGGGGHGKAGAKPRGRAVIDDEATEADTVVPSWGRAARVMAVCGGLWATPIVVAGLIYGWESTLVAQGWFFSKAAMVTFGGAYAVLPYVAQEAVQVQGWLTGPQMLAGLAFAETTPGPLIMVLQFVGFMGGWAQPDGGLSPLAGATWCAAMTTWATFLPCFLWIFLGAPHVERWRGQAGLAAALSGVTAAVAGVVLSLALWFAYHVWHPKGGAADASWLSGVNWFAVTLSLVAFAVLRWTKINVIWVILGAGAVGWAWGVYFTP